MQGFFKKAAESIDSAADKAAQEATAKFGANVGDQISKYGHMAGDKVSNMTQDQVEGDLKGMGINLPNSITGEKAAVPQSANPTTGNVVTKAGAEPAAGVAAPGGANPVTGKGAAEGGSTLTGHAEPAGEPAK